MESTTVCCDQLTVDFHCVKFKFHLAEKCGFGVDRSRRASAIGNEENSMLVLNGSASIADVVALADRREQVSVSARVVEAVDHAHQVAADLSTRFAIYGRTTGVGANRTTSVSPTDTEYGMRLLRSHAVDAGDPLDDRTVRAMLAVRLAQLCVPGAGLDPRILSGLETMLNDDALPELRQYASIGTGDLAPLAGTALTLIGERPASSRCPRWSPGAPTARCHS
jgi:histidine ammonia-lyase